MISDSYQTFSISEFQNLCQIVFPNLLWIKFLIILYIVHLIYLLFSQKYPPLYHFHSNYVKFSTQLSIPLSFQTSNLNFMKHSTVLLNTLPAPFFFPHSFLIQKNIEFCFLFLLFFWFLKFARTRILQIVFGFVDLLFSIFKHEIDNIVIISVYFFFPFKFHKSFSFWKFSTLCVQLFSYFQVFFTFFVFQFKSNQIYPLFLCFF